MGFLGPLLTGHLADCSLGSPFTLGLDKVSTHHLFHSRLRLSSHMPLPQIWRKAAGRIQPALISLPIPIPESEIPPCFAPVSTPKATMLATARPITSSASIASTSTAIGTATTSAPPPLPLARPSRVVSRCAPCSCMPGYGLENIDEDEAEERPHTYTCSLVDAACAYAAATVGSEYVSREERKAAIEARQAAVEDKEAALGG